MLYLLLLFCIPAISQNGNAPRSEQAFKEFFEAMMSSRFTFEKPDREFSLTEDSSGFQNATKKATIKYMLLPASYEEVLKDFRKSEKKSNRLLVDSTSFTQPRTGFTVFEELEAPPGKDSENFITMMTVFPFTKNLAVAVIGAYPKSQDAAYRKKFREAALTLKSGTISE